MNREQQELLDDVYENYKSTTLENDMKKSAWELTVQSMSGEKFIFILSQEEFINKCKTDTEFSEKWGLKIEERELTTVRERKKYDIHFDDLFGEYPDHHETLDKRGVPRKLITITYNDKTIESYE